MKLREDEVLLHELSPEKSVLVIWIFTKVLMWTIGSSFVIFWLVMMVGSTVGIVLEAEGDEAMRLAGSLSGVVFLCTFFLSFLYAIALRGTFRYLITNERCIFIGGIIRYRERSVPYHKITDVERSRNIIERMLGLSSIRIFTPGTGSGMHWGMWSAQRPELEFEGLVESEESAESINLQVKNARDATGI